LLQAESKFVRQDFAGTISLLKLLNPAVLPPEQDWTRARLMIRAYMGQNDLDSALTVATNLLQIARQGHGEIWPANLAESVVLYAGLLEQDRQIDSAMSAWSENLTNTAPVEQQQYAILKIVGLASEQNNLAEAEADLDKFVAQFPSSPAADPALLTLGELHLKDYIARPSGTNDHLALAQAKLDQFIGTYTNSPNLGKAILDRGWCSWLKKEYYDSLTGFQSAAHHPLALEDLAVARFKVGDSYFALHRFSDATNGYYSVLTDFAGVPNIMDSLGARALYQILRAQLELRDSTGLDDTMKQFLGKFASSAPADSSLLLAGQGFSSFGLPAKAREVLQTFEYERPNSPLMADVVFAVGRTFEREQNWAAAATNYEAWLSEYHTNALRPHVEYARDWAVAQAGDEARAFELFTNFVGEYTNTLIGQYTNTLTPLALWWLADHYFRLGTTNYGQAELYYQRISDSYQNDTLAAPARLMAGQAAMRLFNYPEAANVYFMPLISATNCSSDLRDRAIFAYAEASLRMFVSSSDTNYASLQDVTNYLAQVYPETATNVTGAIAWCETGDLDLQMGALDAATNAYAQVIAAPFATPELRNRAQVGLGNILKKKADGLPPDLQQPLYLLALNNYEDVFYNVSGLSDPWWAKEAALQALPLMPQLQKGNVDQFIDSVERWLPSLKDTMEKKRQALKN
jgi:outer membrane protein assembly factor BamD (BamD/ComL family)